MFFFFSSKEFMYLWFRADGHTSSGCLIIAIIKYRVTNQIQYNQSLEFRREREFNDKADGQTRPGPWWPGFTFQAPDWTPQSNSQVVTVIIYPKQCNVKEKPHSSCICTVIYLYIHAGIHTHTHTHRYTVFDEDTMLKCHSLLNRESWSIILHVATKKFKKRINLFYGFNPQTNFHIFQEFIIRIFVCVYVMRYMICGSME